MEVYNDLISRLKALIPMLIKKGKITSQEDLGNKLGYSNKSYVSQLINGKVNNTNFINQLLYFDKDINPDWLYNGVGNMFIEQQTTTSQGSISLLVAQIANLESENTFLKEENNSLKQQLEEYKQNDVQNLDNFFELLRMINEKVDDNSDKLENLENLIKTQQSA